MVICPEGWNRDNTTPGLCYLDVSASNDNIDMNSAQSYCENLPTPATLPIFHTEDEYNSFTNVAQ